MSTANRVIKNTGYLYAKMGITMFISLYTTRLILNSLGASDFGIFNIVGGAIAMLGFLNAAMEGATQRFMSYAEGEGNKEKQTRIFNISVVLHLLISLLVGVVLLIAGYFFFNGILNIPDDRIFAAKVIYGSLIVSTMFTVMTVPYDAVMNAHENMKYYAIVGIIESVLKLAVAFVVVYTLSDKLIVYGVLMACIPLITMVIMRVYCHKHYVECVLAPKRYWHRGLMKEMTGFAGWNFLGSITTIVCQSGLSIILNIFFGTTVNAAQGIANQISGQLGSLGSSIKKAINPVIAKSAGEQNEERMIRSTITGTKVTFFIVTVFFIPVMIDARYILKIWLKNPPEYTYSFCILLLITNIFQNFTLYVPQAISAKGQIKQYTVWCSAVNILPIILSYIVFKIGALPQYMYIMMIVAIILRISLDLYYGKKLCNINPQSFLYNMIIKSIICVLFAYIIGSIALYIMNASIYRLCIIIFSAMLSYSLLFYLIVLDKSEKEMMYQSMNIIKNKIRKRRDTIRTLL